jgi:hypothetical protein
MVNAEVIELAKTQPRSWLAMELDYDLSNLGKVLMGKLRPKRLLDRMSRLREKTDA